MIRAVVVDPAVAGRLAIREVADPQPGQSEALVRVAAISLNRGELRRASSASAGWRPGWDLAGTVERAAANGEGPGAGARVVGLLNAGAWTETVAVPTNALAEVPEGVSLAQAATLPVAGLTALYALEQGGSVLGRNVLITGASGGVGHFALQVARDAGAHVVGLVHQERHVAAAREAGAHVALASEDGSEAAAHGPYDHMLDSIGGAVLGNVLRMLAPDSMCVSFGPSGGTTTTLDVPLFYGTGGLTLYGFILFHELQRGRLASAGLTRLARLVAQGRLKPQLEVEAPWTEIATVAQRLMNREFAGKAVLHLA
jgi:NADPH:quinone reductase-like Zn-dependent oxidoreductase